MLSWQLLEFPCKYLGVPLLIKKLPKSQIQGIIDKVISSLPGWKAALMNRVGRIVHMQYVMTAKIIYTTMAVDLPPWAFKAIEKVQKGFVWRGMKEARGGHCLLAWPKVAWPKELGGLGISNVRTLSWALRARWLWLQKLDPNKPWLQFQIQVCKEVHSLVDMAVVTEIGDGSNTFFWKDRWLHEKKIWDIDPHICALVPKRIANKWKVHEALQNLNWTGDFHGALSVTILLEFVELFQ
jgi:hypothetical protein